MEQPKPSDVNIDALLEIVNSSTDQSTNTELNEAERFCLSVGIRPGAGKITALVIYLRYKEWTKEPIPKDTFYKQFCKLFKIKKTRWVKYYELDASPFTATGQIGIIDGVYIRKGRRSAQIHKKAEKPRLDKDDESKT